MLVDCISIGYHAPRPSGAAIGMVAGLIGVTPAAGYVQPGFALLIGACCSTASLTPAGILCVLIAWAVKHVSKRWAW